MTRRDGVLVTGGTGTLGTELTSLVGERANTALRLVSRNAPPALVPPHEEWLRLDLLRDTLEPALEGTRAVIHLASSKTASDQDERACRRLLAAAEATGVAHFVVISIIGCDRIPLPFYATKVAVEAAVRENRVPWSIVRVSQFHSFVARLIELAQASPIPTPFVHDLRFQPVDEREVAEALLAIALGEPLGNAPDVAGPELLTLGEIASAWFAVTGRPDRLVPVAAATLLESDSTSSRDARPVLEGYREAWNTPHGPRTLGRVRFIEWLERRFATSSR
ncbi:MAG: NAD(P)H-binding protein [Polyangiaceae bacterium]